MGAEKTWCGGVVCSTGAGMYANARSRVRVEERCSETFEALSREFPSGVPWEDLYVDDLVIIAEARNVSGGS